MKSQSLKIKLYLLVIGLLLIMGVGMILSAQHSLSRMEQHISSEVGKLVEGILTQRMLATAGQYGEQVVGLFNRSFAVPETIKAIVDENINADEYDRASRQMMDRNIRQVLVQNPLLSSVYAQFEPRGYDEQDAFYAGRGGIHSNTGTLEIYYYRDKQGTIQLGETEDPSEKHNAQLNEFGIRESEWYLCPRDTGTPCLMEPYLYEITENYHELMTSMVMPLFKEGDFAGVTGVDINLTVLQNMVQQVSQALFDGAAQVYLISERGFLAGASHHADKLGRPLSEALPEQAQRFQTLHQQGGVFIDEQVFTVSYAIDIASANSQWAMLISLPRDVAMAEQAQILTLMQREVRDTALWQLGVGIVVLLASIGLLVMVVGSVVRPLDQIRDRMRNLASAEGDLTKELHIDTHAELIDLAEGFNAFIRRLRTMITELKGVNQQVREQSGDVRHIANDTEQNSTRQHQEIDSVVTAMNEMSATAGEVAGLALEASNNAGEANHQVQSTQQQLASAMSGVKALAAEMGDASEAIKQVASRSEDINRILDVIRGIAEQTNLLALNAAIEAARAGEQGRGFAVVADEVRTLASRTRESTDDINQLIAGLQSDVGKSVQVINSGVGRAGDAVTSTEAASQALEHVVKRIGNIVEHVTQVATAAEEQSTVSEEINRNVTNIGDAASDLTSLAQRLNISGESLAKQVTQLDQQLNRLRT